MFGRRFRFPPFFLLLLAVVIFLARPAQALSTVEAIKARGVLLWGCDISGGAPLAFVDPKDPSKLLGFEAEIAETIARELGVRSQVVQTDWDSLVPGLERGNYDMAMNSLEVTPERQKRVLLSRPYYVYTLQLVVRKDEERIRSIADLTGKKVGTTSPRRRSTRRPWATCCR